MKKAKQNSFKSPFQLRMKRKKSDSIGKGEFTIGSFIKPAGKEVLTSVKKSPSKHTSHGPSCGSKVQLSSALANSTTLVQANKDFKKRQGKP
mmetsp:Transcript_39262/g.59927  ORF Transcript_39262/g.59927 Transcript_39262/m.59927 type:complete len:92 (+) Transcript_39262:1528-1803(+)